MRKIVKLFVVILICVALLHLQFICVESLASSKVTSRMEVINNVEKANDMEKAPCHNKNPKERSCMEYCYSQHPGVLLPNKFMLASFTVSSQSISSLVFLEEPHVFNVLKDLYNLPFKDPPKGNLFSPRSPPLS